MPVIEPVEISNTLGGYHPEMTSMRGKINRGIIACGVLGILIAVLAFWTPDWFEPEMNDPSRAALGEQVEFRLIEELQKIRSIDESWRLRITDEAINAWLATRLKPWMNHHDAAWPEDVSVPQIHFSRSGIDVGIAVDDLVGGLPLIMGFQPILDQGRFQLQPGWVRISHLPIPLARATLQSHLEDLLPDLDGIMADLTSTLLNDAALQAEIPLVDGRMVEISGFRLDSGSMIIQAVTRASTQ